MNKLIVTKLVLFSVFISILGAGNCFSQTQSSAPGDSLILEDVIRIVVQTYPTVKAAEENMNAADARIGLAKAGMMPTLEADANYSRVGPVPSIPFPINGVVENFQLFPSYNFDASLKFNETIYDFGKTSKNVKYESENKKLTEQEIDKFKQNLSFKVSNTFFRLLAIQESIGIKKEQIKNLNEHLDYVTKKKETGSATQYEILTIQVKISGIESQLIDLESSAKFQLSVLNTLMGLPENTYHPIKKIFTVQMPSVNPDSMIRYAEANRYEMKIARQKEVMLQSLYNFMKSSTSPTVNLFALGGGKNGYVPDLNVFKMNFVVGLGIKVPILDGKRNHNNLLIASSTMKSASYETESAHKLITNDVVESQSNLSSAQKKLDLAKIQLLQSEKQYSLAKVNYQAGAITNLELLDATTSLSDAKLQLVKARIDQAVSIYNLRIVLGDKIY